MIFEFINAEGTVIEESYPIGKAPSFIIKDGVQFDRYYSVPSVIMDASKPKTLGDLADANSRQMEKDAPHKKDDKWWRKSKTSKEIKALNNLTREQKINYINTGNKNG